MKGNIYAGREAFFVCLPRDIGDTDKSGGRRSHLEYELYLPYLPMVHYKRNTWKYEEVVHFSQDGHYLCADVMRRILGYNLAPKVLNRDEIHSINRSILQIAV